MDNIKVTVYLSTYNQEPYVAQALDSILMQKTNFKFEIIAADDCSTDRTQKIILDYQKRYPGMIETYFTNPNVGGCKKLTDCIDRGLFRGEYLSYLEGDDYWLGEDRLQNLVDFLDSNPKYSRVSHKRLVIDENDKEIGFDIPERIIGRDFTIEDFLAGYAYSDFGSVFRNYFKEVGSKYHELFWASRNVCDFQDMFITQDFGPVYVMDACYGVYRSRSISGATNYNSITTWVARGKDTITICRTIEQFYKGRYNLTPLIQRSQKRLLSDAIYSQSIESLTEARKWISTNEMRSILPELLFFLLRGKNRECMLFLRSNLSADEKKGMNVDLAVYVLKRAYMRFRHRWEDSIVRGYVTGDN